MDDLCDVLSRKPYYASVLVYGSLATAWAFLMQLQLTGLGTVLFLSLTIVSIIVAGLAARYLVGDEGDVHLEGVTLSRRLFYALLGVVVGVTSVYAFIVDLTETGSAAFFASAWILFSAVVGVLSYRNFKALIVPAIQERVDEVTSRVRKTSKDLGVR